HPDRQMSRRGEHVPGTQIEILVPFSGNPLLWKFRPSAGNSGDVPQIDLESGHVKFLVAFRDDEASDDQLKERVETVLKQLQPAIQKVQFVSHIASVLGWAALVYLAFVYLRTRPVLADLKAKYFSAPRHTDKLGLQFAIGEDLK